MKVTSGDEVPTILLVDDDASLRRVLRRILEPQYACFDAGSLEEATRMTSERRFSVVLLDVTLPDGSGLDWLDRYVRTHEDAAVVVVSGNDPAQIGPLAIGSGAIGHLYKPCRVTDVRSQVLAALAAAKRSRHQRDALAHAKQRAIDIPHALAHRLVVATWLRDGETGQHVMRIREYSKLLGRALGFSADAADEMGEAAVLHDVGKIAVPDGILRKPGSLTPYERRLMEMHTVAGARILGDDGLPELSLARTIARSHHERWDGAGYPDRLRGEEIPLEARVVAVADVYDALSHRRVYKEAWAPERVLQLLHDERGRAFEPRIADCFIDLLPDIKRIASEYPDPDGPERGASGVFRTGHDDVSASDLQLSRSAGEGTRR